MICHFGGDQKSKTISSLLLLELLMRMEGSVENAIGLRNAMAAWSKTIIIGDI